MMPWFGAQNAHWFSYLSLLSLIGVLQIFVDRGRYRSAVTSIVVTCAVLGVGLLALTAFGARDGQPGYILFTLGLTGAVLSVVFGSVLLSLRQQYTVVELRRIIAKEI